MDKNENELTELNRELVLLNNKKINKINFLCSDLTLINIDDFLNKNKINIYLNFAAIKHVRSEESIESIKYMFNTNSINLNKEVIEFSNNFKNYQGWMICQNLMTMTVEW